MKNILFLLTALMLMTSCGADEEVKKIDEELVDEPIRLPFDYFNFNVAMNAGSNTYFFFTFSAEEEGSTTEGLYRYLGDETNCTTGYTIFLADGKLRYIINCDMPRVGVAPPNDYEWKSSLKFKITMNCDIPTTSGREPMDGLTIEFSEYNQLIDIAEYVGVYLNNGNYRVNSSVPFITSTNDEKALKVTYDWKDQK